MQGRRTRRKPTKAYYEKTMDVILGCDVKKKQCNEENDDGTEDDVTTKKANDENAGADSLFLFTLYVTSSWVIMKVVQATTRNISVLFHQHVCTLTLLIETTILQQE